VPPKGRKGGRRGGRKGGRKGGRGERSFSQHTRQLGLERILKRVPDGRAACRGGREGERECGTYECPSYFNDKSFRCIFANARSSQVVQIVPPCASLSPSLPPSLPPYLSVARRHPPPPPQQNSWNGRQLQDLLIPREGGMEGGREGGRE